MMSFRDRHKNYLKHQGHIKTVEDQMAMEKLKVSADEALKKENAMLKKQLEEINAAKDQHRRVGNSSDESGNPSGKPMGA